MQPLLDRAERMFDGDLARRRAIRRIRRRRRHAYAAGKTIKGGSATSCSTRYARNAVAQSETIGNSKNVN